MRSSTFISYKNGIMCVYVNVSINAYMSKHAISFLHPFLPTYRIGVRDSHLVCASTIARFPRPCREHPFAPFTILVRATDLAIPFCPLLLLSWIRGEHISLFSLPLVDSITQPSTPDSMCKGGIRVSPTCFIIYHLISRLFHSSFISTAEKKDL